jgi:hypothetical protein
VLKFEINRNSAKATAIESSAPLVWDDGGVIQARESETFAMW